MGRYANLALHETIILSIMAVYRSTPGVQNFLALEVIVILRRVRVLQCTLRNKRARTRACRRLCAWVIKLPDIYPAGRGIPCLPVCSPFGSASRREGDGPAGSLGRGDKSRFPRGARTTNRRLGRATTMPSRLESRSSGARDRTRERFCYTPI